MSLRWKVASGLFALACLVSTGLLLPALGQDKKEEAKLEFTAFNGKEPFYQKVVTTTEQEMSVDQAGQPVLKQKQKQTFVLCYTPKDKKDDNFVIEQEIKYVQMNITIGTTVIPYDSNQKDQPKNPMTEFFDALMKVKLTLHVGKDMKVKKVEGRTEFIDKLGESHPQMKDLLKSILGEDAIKRMSEQTWSAIPNETKKKGDTWTVKNELNMGAIGIYKNEYVYTFDGMEDGKAKISVKPSMNYEAPKGKVEKELRLPFDIKDSSVLKSEAGSTGTILFDPTKGWIATSNMTMKVKGKLDIDIGGMTTGVNLTQTQESSVTTAATDLTPKK